MHELKRDVCCDLPNTLESAVEWLNLPIPW